MKTIIDGIIVLAAFAVMATLATLVAVVIEPRCLENAYYSQPDARLAKDCTMHIVADPALLHKERWYLRQIAAERARQQRLRRAK